MNSNEGLGAIRHVPIPQTAHRVHQGPLFDIYQWEQVMFDGSMNTLEMARRPDNVSVLISNEAGDLLVTEQEQSGVPAPFYDFPGGRVDAGEDPAAAAERELREETGFTAYGLEKCFEYQASDRVDSRSYVYRATKARRMDKPRPDAGERVKVAWLSLDDVKAWALVNHRLAIVPVLMASDSSDLMQRRWLPDL